MKVQRERRHTRFKPRGGRRDFILLWQVSRPAASGADQGKDNLREGGAHDKISEPHSGWPVEV